MNLCLKCKSSAISLQIITIFSGMGERTTICKTMWVCKPRVPDSIPQYLLPTCHYLVLPPSGQRLTKLLPYCPQMGLTMFIWIWGFSSISLSSFSTYARENVNIRGVTIKNLKIRSGLALWYASLGSRVQIPVICWPLLWYHHRVAKDYPNCCHTVLRQD